MVIHSLLSGWITVSQRQTAGVHTTSKVGGCISPSTTKRCRRDSVHGGDGAQHHQRVCRPTHVRSTSAAKGASQWCGLVKKERGSLAHLHNLTGVCAECFFQNNETHVRTYPSPSGWLFILCCRDGLQPNNMGCIQQVKWEDTISRGTIQDGLQ